MENKKEDKTATNDKPAEEVINYSGIKAMPYIIGNETFEKLGTVGSYTNLVVYLTTVFNMKSVTATTFLNLFNGTASIATLAGAFLSDTYFGRYKSLAFASVASFLGSPLTSVAQVLVASVKKRGLKLPENPAFALFNYFPPKFTNSKLPHTSQFRFLDKAAIITSENEINSDGSATNPWRLCSIQQVEEVKCWVRVVPIWASAIIFNIPMIQQQTYVVLQALQLDRSLGTSGFKVPAATYIIFTMLTLTIWIPIYDRILVPYLRNLTGKEGGFTLLQRMGIGIVLSILCMLVSGLVEEHRKKLAFTRPAVGIAPKGGSISSMSSLWLVPQLALAGLAEGFCYVAQTEFYYKQFPENMRSIAQSFFFANFAVSSYLSGFLVSIVHHITPVQKLEIVCAKWYKYRGAEDDTEEKEPLKHRA
ncbi:hypothetical protein GH714_010991 [Hevea brasiliensis]|uniref:Uncharacterized protein n=1 Tax=Hevea brasiliensis TaxID=3981 RepID=A0A6A6M9G0_HEVBR|nr:hypothetical protein GH714_010991 [Hevea brasiliensis]